jgi:RNA polymerase sigma-70 factor (ECF subfamily)
MSSRGLTKLLHRVAGGDTIAFNEFYEEARPLIRAVLHRTLFRDDFDAAEQEICMSVWQDASKFDRGRGSAETWVAMLTRSRAMDFARASSARRRTDRLAAGDKPEMDEQTPSANFAREELRDQMRSHVDALPEPQRTLVELNFFVGLSQKEIAESLEMPLGTVKSRIRSAFATLAELMPPPPN